MKKMMCAFTIMVLLAPVTWAQNSVPEVSKKPLAAMEHFKGLLGTWESVTEYSADNGETWQNAGSSRADFALRQKGMMLVETPLDTEKPGFHMETSYGYDQYRDVYRVVAVDDVWGIFDLYEGSIDGNRLIVTNLKSGTLFPVAEGVWRGFRISIELSGEERTTVIDKTDDGGKTWQPNFKISYKKL